MLYLGFNAEQNFKTFAFQVGDVAAEACLKMWRNLRDQFVRELRRYKKVRSGDQGPQYISRWPFFEVMKFFSDTVRHRE